MPYKFNDKFILNLNQASESKPKQLGCIVDAMFSFLWIDTAQNKYLTTKNLITIFVNLYIVNVAFPTSIHHLSRRRTQDRHFITDGEAKWLNDLSRQPLERRPKSWCHVPLHVTRFDPSQFHPSFDLCQSDHSFERMNTDDQKVSYPMA